MLSTSVASSTCFYYIFQAADPIVTYFHYSECTIQSIWHYSCEVIENISICGRVHDVSYECLGDIPVPRKISFIPPFEYSYQCSSTFISSYAAVYVYSYLMVLTRPLISFFILQIRSKIKNPTLLTYIDLIVPDHLRPATKE